MRWRRIGAPPTNLLRSDPARPLHFTCAEHYRRPLQKTPAIHQEPSLEVPRHSRRPRVMATGAAGILVVFSRQGNALFPAFVNGPWDMPQQGRGAAAAEMRR